MRKLKKLKSKRRKGMASSKIANTKQPLTFTQRLSSAKYLLPKKPFTIVIGPWQIFDWRILPSRFLVSKNKHSVNFDHFSDACEAIKLDDKNVKGYYRRGQA
jgi:hypothetical protein